jgi:CheY-like chemotaxis protein/two-component sensor histidine kinase
MLAYSGRGKFTIAPVNLSQLIEDVTRLIATLISKKASLQLNLDADLPAIEGDSAQLRQVLINLLTNASDALCERPGTIQVTTGTQEVDDGELVSVLPDRSLPAGTYVFIQVKDTGCGMDEGTVQRIFDPFFTTKFTGRGLGLAAVQGIVRGHHGTLQVESEPGRGATFRVLFPAAGRTIPDASRANAVAENNWCPEGSVLVVDDEPAVRALAREILQRAGLAVMTAVDGYDAVSMFEAHSGDIDAVLLDLTMPGLDGGEVFQRLLQTKPDVKVILCSGYDVQDVNSMLAPHSPAGCLRKPYGPAELLQSFRSIW